MPVPESVLVLHNAPRAGAGAGRWHEADAGVLLEVDTVLAALARLGVRGRVAAVRRLPDLPAAIVGGGESVVFNLVESLPEATGADFCLVPAVCRAMGRAVTGCDAACQLVCTDKALAKAALAAAGIPTPAGVAVPPGAPVPDALPAGRLIVKPASADASEGIDAASIVDGAGGALSAAVMRVHREFGQAALVEQFIDGREFNVSVLEGPEGPVVLPLAEIDFAAFPPGKVRVVDYAAKWLPDSFEYMNTPRKVPADLSEPFAGRVRAMAAAAWAAAGCAGYARVDFRLDAELRPFVLEINPNPDISPDAGFAAALAAAGIPFWRFVADALDAAVRRRGAAAALPSVTASRAPASVPARGMEIRWSRREDRDAILAVVAGTGKFRPGELDTAREVLDEALKHGPSGHYQSYTALADGCVAGWVCFGPTPCTEGTFDIYWIAVSAALQRGGIGAALMEHAEQLIGLRGGRLAVVETSGRPDYEATRRFYVKRGYRLAASVPDFYAPGDAKDISVKQMGGG